MATGERFGYLADGMRTIAIISSKGGSGKTTLTLHLALAAFAEGARVVIADVDGQRSVGQSLRARQSPGPGLVETTVGKLFTLRVTAEREGCDYVFIDTPNAPDRDLVTAIGVADLCVLVGRPTFFDITAAARAAAAVRRLGKPGLIVLNQAPPKRMGVESSAVSRAAEALRLTGLPLAPYGLWSRTVYQLCVAHGLSAAEYQAAGAGAAEVGLLWRHVRDLAAALPVAGPARAARAADAS